MLISLAVILAFVAVWVALVPRVNRISQPPVDVAPVPSRWPGRAGGRSRRRRLPDGWRANAVRFERSTDGLMTWHAGYQSPTGNYIAIEQTKDATDRVGLGPDQPRPGRGDVQAAGKTWGTYVRSGKVQISLVHRAQGPTELTTIVTGTGTFDELTAFAESLRPVPTG